MTASLYLHRLKVDLSQLARIDDERGWARRRRADGRQRAVAFDEGRALHHVLGELFGAAALQPFRLMVAPSAVCGRIYGYSTAGRDALIQQAEAAATPEADATIDWRGLETREMPGGWSKGRRIGFDLKVRPVRRLRSELTDPRAAGRKFSAGAEVDAYLVEALRRFPEERPALGGDGAFSGMESAGRTREAVYRDWLAEKLAGAATLDAASVRLMRFRRSVSARGGGAQEGPDAVLQGDLIVGDPDAFAALLAKGVGRHKAYGFGMLLLRPARTHAHAEAIENLLAG